MQTNVCLYHHGVDNDIIQLFEVHKKKLRNREDREKIAYQRKWTILFPNKSLSGCFRNRSLRSKNTLYMYMYLNKYTTC